MYKLIIMKKKNDYLVNWSINISATTPLKAAREALDCIINGTAKVFEVHTINDSRKGVIGSINIVDLENGTNVIQGNTGKQGLKLLQSASVLTNHVGDLIAIIPNKKENYKNRVIEAVADSLGGATLSSIKLIGEISDDSSFQILEDGYDTPHEFYLTPTSIY
jgi:hypothetical protein